MLKASTEYQLYQAAQSVAQIFEQTNKRAEEISSRASAQRFRIEIDAKIKESIQKIEDKNTEMKSSFDERAFGEGYTVKNGFYRKKIVKDVSVFSVDSENVKVRMWKDFEANDPEVNLSLLEENIDAVNISVIMTLVSAQLTDWENSIFGVSGVVATGDDKASTKTVSYIVGEFEKYAYGEQYKGEVKLGKGLVGKILLDFENNSQKEKAGWEALDAPTWERKLWCSDTFPGPSIREFSTMVASIAATVCTFGAGALLAVAVSAAIMATNELTFELADVGVGYHDWDEAAKNVAKAAVSGAISGASGAAMGAASKVGGIGGVFLKTGITSSSSITTQFTNAFIDGGFSGVVDAFNSWSDWQGIAFSTAGSFVTNGLGAMNSFDSTGKLLNGNTFNTSAMSSFNSLAGGLTTNALEFAFTGQTTFNLANLSMLGLEYGSMWGAAGTGTISGGFLSMTIGENGTHFAISSAGTDISLGTLKLASAGAKESSKVIDWKYGSVETNSTLNSINMLGYTNIGGNQKLSKDIWNEKISVNYTDTGGDYGNYKGGSTINISSTLLGGGAEDYAKLATVLSHEGTHAYDNRIEGIAHSVGLETYTQINQAYDISGDISFAAEMIEAIKDINSWKENTGDTDHWTIKKDGSLVKDKDGWLRDENGMYINSDGTRTAKVTDKTIGAKSLETGLLNILFCKEGYGNSYSDFTDEQKDAAQKLMFDSGMKMEDGDKYTAQWIDDGKEHKIKTDNYMDVAGKTVATLVFMQLMDGRSDAMVFGNIFEKALVSLSMRGKDYAERFNDYVNAKKNFVNNVYSLIDSYDVRFSKDGGYKIYDEKNYKNYSGYHYGIDLSGDNIEGATVMAGLGGKIISNIQWNGTNTGPGNSVHINYGFNFENTYYNTGIYGEYDHLLNQSVYTPGSYVNSNTAIGQVGNTGNSSGPHLHYSVYTTGTNNYNSNMMSYCFGQNYQSTMMQSITHNSDGTIKPNHKYVYDPSYFYTNNRRSR